MSVSARGAPIKTRDPSPETDTALPKLSPAEPRKSVPICVQLDSVVSSYIRTCPASSPPSSLNTAPIASREPVEESDTEVPNLLVWGSPFIGSPSRLHAGGAAEASHWKATIRPTNVSLAPAGNLAATATRVPSRDSEIAAPNFSTAPTAAVDSKLLPSCCHPTEDTVHCRTRATPEPPTASLNPSPERESAVPPTPFSPLSPSTSSPNFRHVSIGGGDGGGGGGGNGGDGGEGGGCGGLNFGLGGGGDGGIGVLAGRDVHSYTRAAPESTLTPSAPPSLPALAITTRVPSPLKPRLLPDLSPAASPEAPKPMGIQVELIHS